MWRYPRPEGHYEVVTHATGARVILVAGGKRETVAETTSATEADEQAARLTAKDWRDWQMGVCS